MTSELYLTIFSDIFTIPKTFYSSTLKPVGHVNLHGLCCVLWLFIFQMYMRYAGECVNNAAHITTASTCIECKPGLSVSRRAITRVCVTE